MSGPAALSARYASAVESYLAGDGESALSQAYEVGREALELGLGPLVLFSVHRDVVARLPPQPIEASEFVSQVTTVFIEALGPFQMTYASFDEARTAVQELSGLLERHVEEVAGVRQRLESMQETERARRRLIADIVTAQEEERRRIAGEIHDDAVQAMSAVQFRLSMLGGQTTDPGQLAVVGQLESIVGDSIGRLRRLIAGLMPPELEQAGLGPAVRSALEHLKAEFQIDFRLDDRTGTEPGPEARSMAFRIVQEALANARKHAQPSCVKVSLDAQDGGIHVEVTDDGVGFDLEAQLRRVRPGHLGLAAMRERAELLGGWLRIDTGSGGTSVVFWLPDRQAAATEVPA
jgi:signal transduction histidine kinase